MILIPILDFKFETNQIKLTDTFVIRRISASELTSLIKHTPEYYNELNLAVGEAKFAIEKRIDPENSERYWSYIVSEDVDLTTLALRLLELGPFRMPYAFYLTHDSLYFETFQPYRALPGENHILSKKQISEFKTMYKALQNAKNKKLYLQFALSQFAASFEHSNEERIIDYITAFESIVFGRGTNAPSPYGRAMGIAIGMLIGKNEAERKNIEKKLNDAYETRNKIVHGHLRHKLGNAESEEFDRLLNFTEKCLVSSIRRFLLE